MLKSLSQKLETAFKYFLPSPLTLAILLTLFTFVLALVFSPFQETSLSQKIGEVAKHWGRGLWDAPMLVFAVQMMLILVLGHILALTPPVSKAIGSITSLGTTPARAVGYTTLFTMLVGFANWGLGLIFGSILARSMAERAEENRMKINYPLLGAAGYSGMLVWHGGLSGSAPLKVAEPDHLSTLCQGVVSDAVQQSLPGFIPVNQTLFSPMNLTISVVLLIVLPLLLAWLAKRTPGRVPQFGGSTFSGFSKFSTSALGGLGHRGAEKLDATPYLAKGVGVLILGYGIFEALQKADSQSLSFVTPNYINTLLLGLGLLLHRSMLHFLKALDHAMGGASGILIQFPLYFGIMGIMREGGLVELIATFFATHSGPVTFPLFTFFSAGLINIFVPSGGGQWVLQGPVIIEACRQLAIPLEKGIMAMAYGDQLTNMIQPFWALPLLAITRLKAQQLLPYTLVLMLVATFVFVAGLLLF